MTLDATADEGYVNDEFEINHGISLNFLIMLPTCGLLMGHHTVVKLTLIR